MGTSGNRPGYKLYSINTTIRNPKRNDEFLKLFVPFEGKPFNADEKNKYLAECVKNGVYRFKNLDSNVKNKLDNGIELTPAEVKQSILDNPQATGEANRVVTQLRSLKDQGFLDFEKGGKNSCYRITNLGKLLLNQSMKLSDIYTIAMLGLHGKSPVRKAVYNETRPFLNTLFVISELKRRWTKPNRECKGLKLHEFGAFVLSMKDCNYRKTVDEIIGYRNKYGLDENKEVLQDYIFNKQKLLSIDYDQSFGDYIDDVFRKFEMTGLLRKRGVFKNTYIDFSVENKGKVDQILNEFGGYYWHEFANKKEYYDFIDSIELPWNKDEESREKALQARADALGVDISIMEGLDNIEKYLDEISGRHALEKQLPKYDVKEIMRELLIVSKDLNAEPRDELASLPESLRLEFLLALLFGAKFGVEHVVSNIHYNEDGEPLSYAGGGQVDISFHSNDLNLIIEATTLKNRDQQVNSETSNLSRHLESMESRTNVRFGMTLVAPYIHYDTCDYFGYTAVRRNVDVCPLTISRIIELLQISDTAAEFKNNFNLNVCSLKELDSHLDEFLSYVNLKYFAFDSNRDKYNKSFLKVIIDKMDNKLTQGTFYDVRV